MSRDVTRDLAEDRGTTASVPEDDPIMANAPTPTTRRETDIARAAYARALYFANAYEAPEFVKARAARVFPYPTRTVTRPRVERVGLIDFRISDGYLEHRVAADANHEPWRPLLGQEQAEAVARLVANPTETVEEEIEE